ncbi:ATP cone domain-containing protein [Edaphobacter modestus]|uniref:ATP cone domain-containing protein n=1 Tax=Edaphobacter modestus TaxID=388466 RepID=UPI001F5E55A5|nr:ATP cone domain-containing protein [Edaphobacter modestus]
MAASTTHTFDTLPSPRVASYSGEANIAPNTPSGFQVIRRNGSFSQFDAAKISVAITKAFVAVEGTGATTSRRIHEAVESLTRQIVDALSRRADASRTIHIEDIQDQVELVLMRSGEHKVARAYVLYREKRAQERREQAEQGLLPSRPRIHVRLKDGRGEPLDEGRLQQEVKAACAGLDGVSADAVMVEVRRNLYDGILFHEISLAQTMAARSLIEQEPNYAYVSARLLLSSLRDEALAFVLPSLVSANQGHSEVRYEGYFPEFIHRAVHLQILDKELATFDLSRLAAVLKPERDNKFQFLGLQTLYDRYFLQKEGVRFELPQAFFMRVAMGLVIREIDRDDRAIEFYELLYDHSFPLAF